MILKTNNIRALKPKYQGWDVPATHRSRQSGRAALGWRTLFRAVGWRNGKCNDPPPIEARPLNRRKPIRLCKA
eukprot:4348533-Pyramimonas_sp.AAC.1